MGSISINCIVPIRKTPTADTLEALDALIRAGKVRTIGCSNFSAGQLREAESAAKIGGRFVRVQNEYSVLHREPETDGVLAECEAKSLAFLPYSPLGNGLLTGKYRAGETLPQGSRGAEGFGPDGFTKQNLAIVESLIGFAQQRGHSTLELALPGCFRITQSPR